jgi:hypothetical protein
MIIIEQHHKSEKDFLLDYIGENKTYGCAKNDLLSILIAR